MSQMSSLEAFEASLRQIIGAPSSQRPFVCQGSPLEASVFICGFNAATATADDFWMHWKPSCGFDKDAWFEAYKTERLTQPLMPGKIRRSAVSNSRRVMEWVVESAAPVKCLETNIYSVPSAAMKDLDASSQQTQAFTYLLTVIKPRLVVAHGLPAAEFLKRERPEVQLITVDHFSRGWSKERAQELGRTIASMVVSDG